MSARIERSWQYVVVERVIDRAKRLIKTKKRDVMSIEIQPWSRSFDCCGLLLRRVAAAGSHQHVVIVTAHPRTGVPARIDVIYGHAKTIEVSLQNGTARTVSIPIQYVGDPRDRSRAEKRAAELVATAIRFGHPEPDVIHRLASLAPG